MVVGSLQGLFVWVDRLMAGLPPPERKVSVRFWLYPLMLKTKYKNAVETLLPRGLVHSVFPSRKFLNQILAKPKRQIQILYGETYDQYGITLDSLKYYFFLADVVDKLKEIGIVTRAVVLIADRAAVMNPSAKDKDFLMEEGRRRKEICLKIASIYHLPVKFQLMSEYANEIGLDAKCLEIQKLIEKSSKAIKLVEKTVLVNKIRQERAANFRYAAEAIAVSYNFDIKIGPPREIYYDKVSSAIGKPYCGVYLKPTYPFCQNFLFYLQNPEIEKYGLTPYKAGSNKLQDCRIILGKTFPKEVEALVNRTELFANKEAANPVEDLLKIGELARKFLLGDVTIKKDVKDGAITLFRDFIYKPLKKGGIYE